MPYLTCPDCRVPQQVSDEVETYQCFSCYAKVVFMSCGECGFSQAIPARWERAFTCGKCEKKVDIPLVRDYTQVTLAKDVRGYGFTYPRF